MTTHEVNNAVNKSGFTLVELLIVILIIGLLSAISIPMYKKAVEKSKVADALSTMQAVSKSEHSWFLARNNYTKDFANLDIDLYDKDGNKAEDESFDSINYTFTLQDSSIKAERNNGEYTIYKDYESDIIYCLPVSHHICQEFGRVNKTICTDNIGGIWHNTSSNCYMTNKDRCLKEYGENFWFSTDEEDDTIGFCGYDGADGAKNGTTLTEGMRCALFTSGNYNNCNGLILKDGAECHTSDGVACWYSKIYSGSACLVDNDGYTHSKCNHPTIYAGGKCVVMPGIASSCGGGTIYSGGVCVGGGVDRGCANSTIKDGGICEGRSSYGCGNSVVESGGTCIAYHSNACNVGWGNTTYSQYAPGSTCQGEVSGGCGGLVDMQGTCVANAAGACSNNTYSGNGCCSGQYCPESAPKCNS